MKTTEPMVLMAREHQPQEINYQARLGEITGRQLDASNLTSYADEALKDLVSLVEQAIDQTAQDTIPWVGAEQERRALEAVGLPPDQIEATLTHIQYVADSIHGLDDLVARKTKKVADSVIVPPDPDKKVEITPSDGSFKEREKRPKLHTLLLLLKIDHGINLEDDDELSILPGRLLPNMMRGISYHLVQIPSLNRMVLVCDELGEVTYVFDSEKCSDYGIAPEYIQVQEKPELEDLQDMDPALVRRIIYTDKSYASRLNDALTNDLDSEELPSPVALMQPQEVLDHIPDGYVTVEEVATQIDIKPVSVRQRIREKGPELGPLLRCQPPGRGGRARILLTPDQAALIAKEPEDVVKDIPQGSETMWAVARELGYSSSSALGFRISTIDPEIFGVVQRLGGNGPKLLTKHQKALLKTGVGIRREFEIDGVLRERPAGSQTHNEMCAEFGITQGPLSRRVAKLDPDEFGIINRYRPLGSNGGSAERLYDKHQQEMLREQNRQIMRKIGDRAAVSAAIA